MGSCWTYLAISVWLVIILCKASNVTSFLPSSLPHIVSEKQNRMISDSKSALFVESNDGFSYLVENGRWKTPNDFNDFLNQCAVQSLIFMIVQLRDRHTAIWLEEFTEPIIRTRESGFEKNDKVLSNMAQALKEATHATQMEKEIMLLKYHGLAAMDKERFPSWETFYEKLLLEPEVVYSIESSRPQVPNYELEINPASLCSRIISVREQISREFVKDLDVIADMSAQMLEKYFEKIKAQSNGDAEAYIENADLLFLERGVTSDYQPSPLRKGNFDLLILLATQESIHRVLNDPLRWEEGSPDRSAVHFLRNFYLQKIGSHFTGSNWYGRANDFLEEILKCPTSVVQLQDEDSGLVDPVRVVEIVLKVREQVALEWLEVALDTPMSHTEIKRLQLNRLMGIDTTIEGAFE